MTLTVPAIWAEEWTFWTAVGLIGFLALWVIVLSISVCARTRQRNDAPRRLEEANDRLEEETMFKGLDLVKALDKRELEQY